MSQVVEQEKPASPQVAHYTAEYQPLARAGAGAAALGGTGARKRDGAVRAPRLSDHEARAVALHERRADRRAHVCAREGRHRRRGCSRPQALSAPVAHAVCVNGRFAPQLSSLDRLPKGVQLLGLEAALASHPALIEPYLAKLSLTQTNAFTSLNTAFLRDGVVADHSRARRASSSRLK